jgi:hypothetical protein
VLQSGIEELHYAERIARLRAYYFDFAPELTHYLASVPPSGRLAILGLRSGYWPAFRTTAGMIGMVTAVLTALPRACSPPSPLATRRSPGSSPAGWWARCLGGTDVVPVFGLGAGHQLRLFEDEQERPDAG